MHLINGFVVARTNPPFIYRVYIYIFRLVYQFSVVRTNRCGDEPQYKVPDIRTTPLVAETPPSLTERWQGNRAEQVFYEIKCLKWRSANQWAAEWFGWEQFIRRSCQGQIWMKSLKESNIIVGRTSNRISDERLSASNSNSDDITLKLLTIV